MSSLSFSYEPERVVDRCKGKTFTIVNCDSDGTITMEDQKGRCYIIDVDKSGKKVEMTECPTTEMEVDELWHIVIHLAEMVGVDLDKLFDEATSLRLCGELNWGMDLPI